MRRQAMLAGAVAVTLACGQGSSTGGSRSPTPSTSASAGTPGASSSPTAGPSPVPLTGTYGLLLSAGTLQLINADASVAATVPVASASAQYCSSQHDVLIAEPPVSATNDAVYFRDGDTQIRVVIPPSSAADVTTVPGGPNVISFFSVSPDDQRIAVLVEDVSSGTAISQRMYVEDLHGGGNRVDIYTAQTPKDKRGMTLWPMGWHAGNLVLAVVPACTFTPGPVQPTEWHVASSGAASRIATITGASCTLSIVPSPAGVGCINAQSVTSLFDWTGKVIASAGPGSTGSGFSQTGLSPAGHSIFFSTGTAAGAATATTGIVQLGPGPYATVQGHSACAWIDEDHVMAPDAVIQFPAETPGNVQVTANVTTLAASGLCAGRFPGGL